jgi:nitroreductase
MLSKPAETSVPILKPIADRWSPRAFTQKMLAPEQLAALFEAARWAASANNRQPWRFVYGWRGTPAFEAIFGCLLEGNQSWARNASVLMVNVARLNRDDGQPNPTAVYDLGQAIASLAIQATSMGIHIHQMAGFKPDQARVDLGIPEDCRPVAACAIGFHGDIDGLSDSQKEREHAPRTRLTVAEITSEGAWPKG